MGIKVTEIVPGELDVTIDDGTRCRVLIPAGVGIPGVGDEAFAGALVATLAARGTQLPAVLDASALLRSDPRLIDAVADVAADSG